MSIFNGKPDLVIGDQAHPYMLRWHLFRWRHFPRIYIHKFLRSDDDRAPHDHPWWFVSILLWGSYVEHRWIDGVRQVRRRTAPSIAFRPISTRHRVELTEEWYDMNSRYGLRPAWTLIVTGRDVRGWGFWCPREQFVPASKFQGCGE